MKFVLVRPCDSQKVDIFSRAITLLTAVVPTSTTQPQEDNSSYTTAGSPTGSVTPVCQDLRLRQSGSRSICTICILANSA